MATAGRVRPGTEGTNAYLRCGMNDIREYTIWNTPLSVLLRGRIGPGAAKQRIDAVATVRQSDLPEPAKAMIVQVIKKTRLWKYEK